MKSYMIVSRLVVWIMQNGRWRVLGMLLNSVASLIWVILAFLILGTTRVME
jgi:hypothetical protein